MIVLLQVRELFEEADSQHCLTKEEKEVCTAAKVLMPSTDAKY